MKNLDILKDKNLLFVEDDEEIIKSIEPLFKKTFNNLFISRNTEEGLETFEKNQHIDFVITDLKVSKMDGLDMLASIKAIKEETSSILMSSDTDADYESFLRADEIGVYRYLLKPLNIEELLKAMVAYAEQKN